MEKICLEVRKQYLIVRVFCFYFLLLGSFHIWFSAGIYRAIPYQINSIHGENRNSIIGYWSRNRFSTFLLGTSTYTVLKYIIQTFSYVKIYVITYDIWIFTFVCLCKDNFLPQLVCLRKTILPAAFYYHCLPFECTYIILLRYVICNYIWHMESQNHELYILENIFCYFVSLQISNYYPIFYCLQYS